MANNEISHLQVDPLKPYEKATKSYSSAKLEVLALRWAVCDKFKDYLFGSKSPVLTDNNPLCYVNTSKLEVSQIRWLSDLALFDFDKKFQAGRKNQAADTPSHCSLNPDSSSESDDNDDNWETISYGMVCQSINHVTESTILGMKFRTMKWKPQKLIELFY